PCVPRAPCGLINALLPASRPVLASETPHMRRLFLLAAAILFLLPATSRADAFDLYINTVLEKVPTADGAKEIKQLTPDLILDNNRLIPDVASAMIVVQTNESRLAKVLVQAARKRLNDEKKTQVDILLIDRYATYKAGTERAVVVQGQ